MARRTLALKNVPLCNVTGVRGGSKKPISATPDGSLAIGMTRFQPQELEKFVKTKGERRRVRRALFRNGLRGAAAYSIPRILNE